MDGLVYLHPLGMLAVIALGFVVLRDGLAIRNARLRRKPFDTRRHRRLAKILIVVMALGWLSGVGSMVQTADLDKNGAVDVLTSTNRGTFVFWGTKAGKP